MPPLTQPCQTPVTPPPPRRLPLSREDGANAGRGRSTRSQCGLGSFEYGAVARTGNFVTGGCGCEPRLRSVRETPSRHPLPVPACYALHLWSLWSRAVGTRSEGRVPKPAARPLRPHGNLCFRMPSLATPESVLRLRPHLSRDPYSLDLPQTHEGPHPPHQASPRSSAPRCSPGTPVTAHTLTSLMCPWVAVCLALACLFSAREHPPHFQPEPLASEEVLCPRRSG